MADCWIKLQSPTVEYRISFIHSTEDIQFITRIFIAEENQYFYAAIDRLAAARTKWKKKYRIWENPSTNWSKRLVWKEPRSPKQHGKLCSTVNRMQRTIFCYRETEIPTSARTKIAQLCEYYYMPMIWLESGRFFTLAADWSVLLVKRGWSQAGRLARNTHSG